MKKRRLKIITQHDLKLMAAYKRVVKRHGPTFQKLARAESFSSIDGKFNKRVRRVMGKHDKTLRKLAKPVTYDDYLLTRETAKKFIQ